MSARERFRFSIKPFHSDLSGWTVGSKNPSHEIGGLAGTRTQDQRLKRPLLYRLSYQPTIDLRKAWISRDLTGLLQPVATTRRNLSQRLVVRNAFRGRNALSTITAIRHNSCAPMGRSYWFECSKCGYRAHVSGKFDRGLNFAVQTILCRECRRLYDAVVHLRVPDELKERSMHLGLRPRVAFSLRTPSSPPTMASLMNRLPYRGIKYLRWLRYRPQCPVSAYHQVREWNSPDKCPRCDIYLEQNVIPYRIWD